MAFFRKIKAGLVKDEIENYIGEEGNIFFNVETGEIRLSDGITPGGISVSGGGGGGGGGNYILPTASTTVKGGIKIDGTTIKINNQVISGFSGSYSDLTNRPTFSAVATSGSYNDLTNRPNLSTVATSGSYNDLTNRPVLFSGAYADLTGKPTLFSGSYSDLTNKPTLSTVATTGSYSDLTNKPTLFSGSYNDLTNKPTLFSGAYADLTGKPTLFSGSYNDLTNKPTLFSGAYADLTGKPTLSTVATTGSYNDLTDKPTGGTGGGSSTGVIKTYNILNEFTAPLIGNSIFVPTRSDTIKSVQLTNGRLTTVDITLGLYRNNELLQFVTLPAGMYTTTITGLNYPINTNDYISVNVVNGSGINFTMALLNI